MTRSRCSRHRRTASVGASPGSESARRNLIAERRRGARMPSPYLRETHRMLAMSKHARLSHPAGGAGVNLRWAYWCSDISARANRAASSAKLSIGPRRRRLDTMKRIATLVTAVALLGCWGPVFPQAAQTMSHRPVKPKSGLGHKVPMRHDQLTLYPRGRPARREPAYSYTRHRFDQPSAIHNTFLAAQRW